MVSSREAYFDPDFVFKGDMAFAFGLTAYDDNEEPIEDPSIGVLRPYFKQWGMDQNLTTPIEWRYCTKSELRRQGYDDTESPFFEFTKAADTDIGTY